MQLALCLHFFRQSLSSLASIYFCILLYDMLLNTHFFCFPWTAGARTQARATTTRSFILIYWIHISFAFLGLLEPERRQEQQRQEASY